MSILITGVAGFIGYHTAQRLLGQGHRVIGVDNMNAYYDPALKRARLSRLTVHPRFQFIEADIANTLAADAIFTRETIGSRAASGRLRQECAIHLKIRMLTRTQT